MPVGRKSSIRRRFAANSAGGTAASGSSSEKLSAN